MHAVDAVNRRITLAAHPQGLPAAHDSHLDTQPVPTPGEGQVWAPWRGNWPG